MSFTEYTTCPSDINNALQIMSISNKSVVWNCIWLTKNVIIWFKNKFNFKLKPIWNLENSKNITKMSHQEIYKFFRLNRKFFISKLSIELWILWTEINYDHMRMYRHECTVEMMMIFVYHFYWHWKLFYSVSSRSFYDLPTSFNMYVISLIYQPHIYTISSPNKNWCLCNSN